MVISLLEVEPTPNPNAYKFITDQMLLDEGSKLNVTVDEKDSLPQFYKGIFDLGGIDTVMVAENFVSISGNVQTDWDIVHVYLERNLTLYSKEEAEELAAQQKEKFTKERESRIPQSELRDQIEELMDTYVRPALAGDGGGLELIAIDGNVVTIRYQGACGSCPTSTQNTLSAIENLLRNKVDPDIVLQPG